MPGCTWLISLISLNFFSSSSSTPDLSSGIFMWTIKTFKPKAIGSSPTHISKRTMADNPQSSSSAYQSQPLCQLEKFCKKLQHYPFLTPSAFLRSNKTTFWTLIGASKLSALCTSSYQDFSTVWTKKFCGFCSRWYWFAAACACNQC